MSAGEQLHDITRGIDACEVDDDSGWWETSGGAEFGRERLTRLEALVAPLDAVRELHRVSAFRSDLGPFCANCPGLNPVRWPCPTAELVYSADEVRTFGGTPL